MRNNIGIAFAGAGIVAEMHGRGVAANANATLIGAYDPEIAKAQAITKKFGGRVFSTLEDLLADPLVDAVHVLTPTKHHVATALASLSAGKHVLIEKPVPKARKTLPACRQRLSSRDVYACRRITIYMYPHCSGPSG